MSATIVIGHLVVSKLSASTSTLQFMLRYMSASTVIVHLEANKLWTNLALLPMLTLLSSNATIVIGHLAASKLSTSTLGPTSRL
jgi:hypothetical protein